MKKEYRQQKAAAGRLTGKLMLSGALILVSGAYALSQHAPAMIAQPVTHSAVPPMRAAALPQGAPLPPVSIPGNRIVPPVPGIAKPQGQATASQVAQPEYPAAIAQSPVKAPSAVIANAPPQEEAPTVVASNAIAPSPAPVQMSGRYIDGDFTGPSTDTPWGTVQVTVHVQGGAIAAVYPIDYPDHRRRSIQINEEALPILEREVIQAQSASVDIVTQATTTSLGYLQSLSTALTQAKKQP